MGPKETNIYLELSGESTARLRGHQSVRTTFKLSERSISALSILAGQLGIKQKSLFDHLVEDVKVLQAIAREVDTFPEHRPRVAKTYVISRRTLENLETVSSKFNTPRDALVEFSIERTLPLIGPAWPSSSGNWRTEAPPSLSVRPSSLAMMIPWPGSCLGWPVPVWRQPKGSKNIWRRARG